MGAQVRLSGEGAAPLEITGAQLQGIEYDLSVPSAQVKTALMFAGLSATGGTVLRGRTDSRDHTERMLPRFGATVDVRGGAITVEGGQRMRGIFIEIPGDLSSAAFWIAAASIVPESCIELRDVSLNATRTGFLEVLQRMGASIETTLRRREPEPVGTIRVQSSSLRGVAISEAEVPSLVDELPLLAVLATQSEGTTTVRGAAELRIKESDRIEAIARVLRAMGAEIETFDDGFAVQGKQTLRGATIDSAGDHRIAMAGAIAALIARGETILQNAECVGVSYPSFFSTLGSLGASVQS
jgi:3-phosphoshikimate 1-carboxyvinyltransferase